MILICSDGLSEAGSGEEELGVEKINKSAEHLYNLSPEELINLLLKILDFFKDSTEGYDYLTILAVKRVDK